MSSVPSASESSRMIEKTPTSHNNRDGVTYRFGGASCVVYTSLFSEERRDCWYISSVYCWQQQRGRGYARRVLQAVCDDADASGVPIALVALANEERGALTQERLEEFYASFGFVFDNELSVRTTTYVAYWVRVPVDRRPDLA